MSMRFAQNRVGLQRDVLGFRWGPLYADGALRSIWRCAAWLIVNGITG
jgi:hypothetical protein